MLARLTDDLPIEAAGVMGFAACFAVRGLALYFGWQMPAYKMRAEPEPARVAVYAQAGVAVPAGVQVERMPDDAPMFLRDQASGTPDPSDNAGTPNLSPTASGVPGTATHPMSDARAHLPSLPRRGGGDVPKLPLQGRGDVLHLPR